MKRRLPVRTDLVRRSIDPATAEWRFTNGPDVDGTFAGYLSIFNVTDSYGTRMLPGCWTAGGLDAERLYPLLDMHDTTSAVRSVLGGFKAREDEKGLFIEGQYAATQAGQEARVLAGMGFAPELSVGFVERGTLEDDPMGLTICELHEGSQIIKGFASTPGAALTSVRSTEMAHRTWPPIAGSHEERAYELQQAATVWAAAKYGFDDDAEWWLSVEATFDDNVVVAVFDYAREQRDWWRLPYTATDSGITFGEATAVDVVSEIVPARAADVVDLEMRRQRDRQRAAMRLRLTSFEIGKPIT